MDVLNKRWLIAAPLAPEAEQELLDFNPLLRQILHNRGYTGYEAARRYLEALPPPDADPSNLLGIPQAVERIRGAIAHQEQIAVYGDYDADGVTATALLTQALSMLGANVRPYIPNRFDEGYGLNTEALDTLRQAGVRLVITVDCGVRSPQEVEDAHRQGLDIIISDHHQPGAHLPQALAIIDPKQEGDSYPDKDLAGVGLAYKLAEALFTNQGVLNPGAVEDFLDLVALGTVADVAPLTGENRSLVRQGLRHIHYTLRQGLLSLIGVSGLQPQRVTAESIGYALGPRLNAAGRLDSALAALELLITPDVHRAAMLAQTLDNQNRERQQITRDITAQAEQLALAEDPQALLLFAVHPDFNCGVVGLAASRLVEQYYRPAIVACSNGEFTRGSCRSIPEFHITRALDACADLLVRHGGHAAAAGFTVRTADLKELVERLKGIAQDQLVGLDLRPTLRVDAQIDLSSLRAEQVPEILSDLARLQPTGHGNPQPLFISRGLRVNYSRTVGRDNTHLKLSLNAGRATYDAIAFRQGFWQPNLPERVDVLYLFELNEYNGRLTLQLNVRDIKPAGLPED